MKILKSFLPNGPLLRAKRAIKREPGGRGRRPIVMRRLGAAPARRNSRVARPPGPVGRRAVAAACVLAALPLAGVAGWPAPAPAAPPPAGAAPPLSTSLTAGQVALQFGPTAAGATGPAPAAIATFRWSALAGSPLGYRNSPLLAWAGGRLIEVGGWAKGSGTGRSAAAASFDPGTGRWGRLA